MVLLDLPHDLLLSIIQDLDAVDLAFLSAACHALETLVNDFGWKEYLRRNPRPSRSLHIFRQSRSSKARVRYDHLADRSWGRSHLLEAQYVARPLSRQWRGKLQPIMAISDFHLVVASGRTLYLYKFFASQRLALALERTLPDAGEARCDITSLSMTSDDGRRCVLLLGFQNGGIQQVTLHTQRDIVEFPRAVFADMHGEDLVQSLKSDGDMLLSLSSTGSAALTNTSSNASSIIYLQMRSWVSHLSLHSSTPFAAFGISSSTPLVIHSISESELSPAPSLVLAMSKRRQSGGQTSSGVYGISRAPLASPWGASPQILVSGWYDGFVRVHDLRASFRAPSESGEAPVLSPVMSVCDPLLYEPIYSVSSGGGSASYIAAGSARHSVVSFWDVRSPGKGWSVHAPGNDSSPVYDIVLESSRLYGVTESRPFVLDFGPGVTKQTYPHVARNPGRDGLKSKKGDDVSFYVTQYRHKKAVVIE